MCGIAGYVGWERDPLVSARELRAMCDEIVHRGPDGAGYLVRPGVAMGMRRLSIIDLAGSDQPIGNEDGTVQVVFNGEIYNYRELRQQLTRSGHRLTTGGDTETLVHLYEERGLDLVDALRGMFGFAIWDAKRERLLLGRDRLGIKPLYYWESDGGLAFASELKSLAVLPRFPRALDPVALGHYLALGYVPDPECIFPGVRKLPPGHLLEWGRRTGTRVRRYWSPVRGEDATIAEKDAIAEFRRLFSDAVRYRLIADVPLGAFLSGGLDSTAVVAEMGRQMDRPVQTFSIGFAEPEFNEAPAAAAMARALGTRHRDRVARPDAAALLGSIVHAFDEPFADSSAIPTLLVSTLAREHVTVALSGDGGDELFGGYTRYRELSSRNVPLPSSLRSLVGTIARGLPHAARGRNRLLELSRSQEGRYAGMVADPLYVAEGGVCRDFVAEAGGSHDDLLRPWFEQTAGRDFATRMMLVDTMSYLPGDILTKVDRMSMAASLEARVPLLDHHLVEFAATLPAHLKLRDGTGKWLFRRAVADLVPPAALIKPKQGFGVPLRLWLRGELRHHLDELSGAGALVHQYVDPLAVRRVAREHQEGRRDHSPLLWKLIVLEAWLSIHSGTRARADPPEPRLHNPVGFTA